MERTEPSRLRAELPTIAAAIVVVAWLAIVLANGFRVGWAGITFFEIAGDVLDGTWFSEVRFKGATYFAPGYPLLLALTSKLTGASLLAAAKAFTLIGWLATIVGVRVLYRDLGGRPGPWEWVVLAFAAVSPQILTLHMLVLPEALYIAACVWTLVVLERFADRPTWLLGLSLALLAGSSVWLRYAGVGLAGAAGLRLLLQREWPWSRRLGGAVIAGAGVALLCAWLLVQIDAGHGSSPTTVTNQSFELADIANSIGSFGSHLVFGVAYSQDEALITDALDPLLRTACVLVGSGLIALLAVATWRGRSRRESSPVLAVIEGLRTRRLLGVALYAVGTIGFLCVWRFKTGYMILPRYWTPVVLPLLTAALAVWSRRTIEHPTWRRVPIVLAGGLLVVLTLMSAYLLRNPREDAPGSLDDLEASTLEDVPADS